MAATGNISQDLPPKSSAPARSCKKRATEDLVQDKVSAPPCKLAKQSDKQPARPDSVEAACKHEHGPGVICFEEKAVALLNHPGKIQYFTFTDLLEVYYSTNRVQIGRLYVPEHLEASARYLLENGVYMGPTKDKRLALIDVAFVGLCWAKKSMDESSPSEINEFLILKWRDCVFCSAFAGLKVDFMKERLKSITKAYLARNFNGEEEQDED